MIDFIENAEKEASEALNKAKLDAAENEKKASLEAESLMRQAVEKAAQMRRDALEKTEEQLKEHRITFQKEGEKQAAELEKIAMRHIGQAIEYCCRKVVE